MDIRSQVQEMTNSFFPYAKQRLGFKDDPEIFLKDDPENAEDPLGKTAFYDPEKLQIVLYVSNRHLIDICRSLSHELVHHMQNCRGDLKGSITGENYAQTDSHLREMETEAYTQGNLIFRDFQDSRRQKRKSLIRIVIKK